MSKMISKVTGLVLISFLMVLTGVMSTNAQTVSTVASGFGQAAGVAFDSSGNMYVSARSQNKIMKVTPAGVVSTFAGSGTYGLADGAAATAKFAFPQGLTIDTSNNVYVNDSNNKVIRKITPAGVVSTIQTYGSPGGMVADASGNLFYIVNRELHKLSGSTDTVVAGKTGCNTILNGVGTAACFTTDATGLAMDSSGNLYTIDRMIETVNTNVVRKITPNFAVSELGPRGQLAQPLELVVDASGNVLVGTGSAGNKIFKVTQAGVISVYAGSTAGSTDGNLATATFSFPKGLAFYGGALYVADYNNGKVRKIQ